MATKFYMATINAHCSKGQICIAILDKWHIAACSDLRPIAACVLIDDLRVIHPYELTPELRDYYVNPGSEEWRAALQSVQWEMIHAERRIAERIEQRSSDLS